MRRHQPTCWRARLAAERLRKPRARVDLPRSRDEADALTGRVVEDMAAGRPVPSADVRSLFAYAVREHPDLARMRIGWLTGMTRRGLGPGRLADVQRERFALRTVLGDALHGEGVQPCRD